jgi:hypothetical protein
MDVPRAIARGGDRAVSATIGRARSLSRGRCLLSRPKRLKGAKGLSGAEGLGGAGISGNETEYQAVETKRDTYFMPTLLLIVLLLLLVGVLPTWPYSAGWGYYPGGGVGLLLIICVVLLLTGWI